MTNSQRLAVVRNYLSRWIAGVTGQALQRNGDSIINSESMLIRDGFFCGRCFHAAGYRAVWFIEEDELKIYAEDGKLQRVFHGGEMTASADLDPDQQMILAMPQRTGAAGDEEVQNNSRRRAA